MRFGLRIAFAWILAADWACAGQGLLADGHLDTAAIRDAYLQADLVFVRGTLEGYIKSHPKDVPAAEKVFTHMYLGAAYSGGPEGKARAEAHFRAALRLAPDANPADLYLSPAIKAGFEELRAAARPERDADIATASGAPAKRPAPGLVAGGPESARQEDRGSGPDESGKTEGKRPGRTAEAGSLRPGGGRAWLWWTLGGAAVAAAVGAGSLGWILKDPEAQPRRIRVDATLK